MLPGKSVSVKSAGVSITPFKTTFPNTTYVVGAFVRLAPVNVASERIVRGRQHLAQPSAMQLAASEACTGETFSRKSPTLPKSTVREGAAKNCIFEEGATLDTSNIQVGKIWID